MPGFVIAALLSACSTAQVEPNYWQQWNQFGPFDMPGSSRTVPGQRPSPGQGYESWDWRYDPLGGPRVPAPPRINPPRPTPPTKGPGRYRGPGGAVRQSLNGMTADSPTLKSYRKALEAMKKLPPEDPHSLIFQANIHGYPDTPKPDPLWGQCQHGNWWFLPWHRAYLYCFEKIVRRYAEDPDFALPYWDYGTADNRALPAPFRDKDSVLYDGTRRAQVNSGTDQLSAAIVVDGFNASMANKVFADFGPVATFGGQALNAPQHRASPHGAIEAVPHDLVHGFVGGNMATVEQAPRDPVFFCHHANIDRMWVAWLQMGDGRANPSNDAWLNQQFTFYDEKKEKVTLTMKQVADIAALGYSYDRTGPPAPPPPSTPAPKTPVETVATLDTAGISLQDRPVTLTMAIPQGARSSFPARNKQNPAGRSGTPASAAASRRIYLQLDGVRIDGAPDSTVAVYIDLPPYSAIPGPRSANFAGYFTFFGDHHHHGYACRLDVTRHLWRLWQTDSDQRAEFTVTLVRTPPGILPREFPVPITFKELVLTATK